MKLLFKNKIKLNTHKNFYNLYYFKKEKFFRKESKLKNGIEKIISNVSRQA